MATRLLPLTLLPPLPDTVLDSWPTMSDGGSQPPKWLLMIFTPCLQ